MIRPGASSHLLLGNTVRLRSFAGDSDFPRMANVANAAFAADGIDLVRRAEDVRRDYAAMPRWDSSRDIRMAEIQGELVGYARTWDWTTGDDALVQGQIAFVHPGYRRRGVGSALLNWLEDRQREIARERAHGTNWHQAIVTEREAERAALLQKAGYQVARRLFEMERSSLEHIPDFPLPAGFEVRPVQVEHLRAIYDAHMDALRDVWGYSAPRPGDFEAWKASRTSSRTSGSLHGTWAPMRWPAR